jgi:hypothetical protein
VREEKLRMVLEERGRGKRRRGRGKRRRAKEEGEERKEKGEEKRKERKRGRRGKEEGEEKRKEGRREGRVGEGERGRNIPFQWQCYHKPNQSSKLIDLLQFPILFPLSTPWQLLLQIHLQ